MKPISPVVPGYQEVVYAKDQPECLPLPALRIGAECGEVVTRWKMSWRERLRALWTGSIYLTVLTFNQPLQPVMLSTEVTEDAMQRLKLDREQKHQDFIRSLPES